MGGPFRGFSRENLGQTPAFAMDGVVIRPAAKSEGRFRPAGLLDLAPPCAYVA